MMLTKLRSREMDYSKNQHHACKYFCPRWERTQVTFFASCLKSENTKEHGGEEDNFILTEERIKSNGNQQSERVSNCSETSSKSGDGSSVSMFDMTDEVFTGAQLQRRASEPGAKTFKRNGGPLLGRLVRRKGNKLRSLSEGGNEGRMDEKGRLESLTKNSQSNSGDASRPSTAFNFMPQVVRKTSLRSSLQDWLESEKHSEGVEKMTRCLRTGDSRVNPKKKLRILGKSKSLNPDHVVGEERDCNNNTTCAPKHVYRRFSADSVEDCPSWSLDRRPSAPPVFNAGRLDSAQNVVVPSQNAVSAQTVTTQVNLRSPAPVVCCNSDIKYDNMHDFQIHCVMKEELRLRLADVAFCADTCRSWCEEISVIIKERVQRMVSLPSKVVCTVYIGALRDSGIHSATQALIDFKMDNQASACYQNKSLFAVASVFAVHYGCK